MINKTHIPYLLDQTSLLISHRTSGRAEQNSRRSLTLPVANIRVARAHMNKPHDLNGSIKIGTVVWHLWGTEGDQRVKSLEEQKKTRKQIGGAVYVGTAL